MRGRPFRINKKSRLANELCEEGAAGRKKNLLTSSRALLNACQAGYLQADWSDCYWFPGKAGSRIRDQLKIYQINYPYVTQGFLEKPDQGSRIKDQGSWFLIRLLQETVCYYDFCFFNTISFYVYNLLLLLLLLLLCCHVSMFTPSSNKAVPIKLSCLRESSLEDRIL